MSRSVAKNFFKKEEKFQKQVVTMVKFVFCIFYCGTIKKKKINLFPAIPEAHANPSMHSAEQPSGAQTPPTASRSPWPASRGPGNPRLPAWGCCVFSPVSEPIFHHRPRVPRPPAFLWPVLVLSSCSPSPKKTNQE